MSVVKLNPKKNSLGSRIIAAIYLVVALGLSGLASGGLYMFTMNYEGKRIEMPSHCIMTKQNVLGQDCYECEVAPYERCVRSGLLN